jgi:hypothetical protein
MQATYAEHISFSQQRLLVKVLLFHRVKYK